MERSDGKSGNTSCSYCGIANLLIKGMTIYALTATHYTVTGLEVSPVGLPRQA
jgi:hypothetical protein